jgi:hypothetical protein
MNRSKREKGFDCVVFKRQAQAKIYEEIKGLSPDEEIEYFRSRVAAGPFRKLWKALERRSRLAKGPVTSSAATPSHPIFTK